MCCKCVLVAETVLARCKDLFHDIVEAHSCVDNTMIRDS